MELSEEPVVVAEAELLLLSLGVDFSKKRFFGGNAEVIMVFCVLFNLLTFFESRLR